MVKNYLLYVWLFMFLFSCKKSKVQEPLNIFKCEINGVDIDFSDNLKTDYDVITNVSQFESTIGSDTLSITLVQTQTGTFNQNSSGYSMFNNITLDTDSASYSSTWGNSFEIIVSEFTANAKNIIGEFEGVLYTFGISQDSVVITNGYFEIYN